MSRGVNWAANNTFVLYTFAAKFICSAESILFGRNCENPYVFAATIKVCIIVVVTVNSRYGEYLKDISAKCN